MVLCSTGDKMLRELELDRPSALWISQPEVLLDRVLSSFLWSSGSSLARSAVVSCPSTNVRVCSYPTCDDSALGVRGVCQLSGKFCWCSVISSSLSNIHHMRLQGSTVALSVCEIVDNLVEQWKNPKRRIVVSINLLEEKCPTRAAVSKCHQH